MNLTYLPRHEIDDQKWNQCIDASSTGNVYALSWFLDNWNREWTALVEQGEDHYVTVMPFQMKRHLGIHYVYQHPMVVELGVFTIRPIFDQAQFDRFVAQAFAPFRYVAKYRFYTGSLLYRTPIARPTQHTTHHLLLNQPYSEIYQSYTTNRKRNLKRSQGYEQRVTESQDIVPLTNMHARYTIPRIEAKSVGTGTYVAWDGSDLVSLFAMAKQHSIARLYYVVDALGQPLAGGLYFEYHQRIIYYFGSATTQGLSYQSMTYLMDYIIRQHAENPYVLDFEGSMDPGVARFYRSFGSIPMTFDEIQILRLPAFLRYVNDIRRALQRKMIRYYRSSRSILSSK